MLRHAVAVDDPIPSQISRVEISVFWPIINSSFAPDAVFDWLEPDNIKTATAIIINAMIMPILPFPLIFKYLL